MKVEDVMTRDVISVRPTLPLKEVAAMLAERRISGVPVVDEAGRVLGVVSEADILLKERTPSSWHEMWAPFSELYGIEGESKLRARTAGEAMTTPARTITRNRTVGATAATMLDAGVHRLPVVDAKGKVVGIVTRADLVRAFVRRDQAIRREIRRGVLLQTRWLEPRRITVSVDGGEVRLAGTVDTTDHAELLTRLVQSVPGVVCVDSRLIASE